MMTMSNQNMNWNQFLTEFVLRAMTNNIHEQYFSPSDAARLAQLAWDAIQAAPLPKSEIALLAKKALEISDSQACWLAIDGDGSICAFNCKPTCYERFKNWDINDENLDLDEQYWAITQVNPPANFRNELYEISKILNNEQ